MSEQIGQFRAFLFFSAMVAASIFSYFSGFAIGNSTGFANGYSKGQVDLALEIQAVLNEKINENTEIKTYRHFKDIKDITLYAATINGVKTIATWEEQREHGPSPD